MRTRLRATTRALSIVALGWTLLATSGPSTRASVPTEPPTLTNPLAFSNSYFLFAVGAVKVLTSVHLHDGRQTP